MKILTATAIAASLLLAHPVDADAKYRGSYRSYYSRPAISKPAPAQPKPQPQQAPAPSVTHTETHTVVTPSAPAGGSFVPSLLGAATGAAVGTMIGDALISDPAAPCYDDNGNARPCAALPADR